PVGDPKAHTFDVKILPDNQDGRLLPGMFAQVQVTTASSGDAVLVPVGALVQQGNNSVVFVAANGRASARTVQAGIQDGTNAQILSGVPPGEAVVTTGQNNLRDGQAVQVPGQGGQAGQGQGGQGAQGAQGQSAPATPAATPPAAS